jgi:hypothetical protein
MMAIFKQFGSLNGVVDFEFAYDDSAMKMDSFKIDNKANDSVLIEIISPLSLSMKINPKTILNYQILSAQKPSFNYEVTIKQGIEKIIISGISWRILRGIK